MLNYPSIDPVAVDLGVLQIRWYGISYICGIVLAWWLLRHRAIKKPKLGWTAVQVSDLIYYGTLGVIIGGRLAECPWRRDWRLNGAGRRPVYLGVAG